MDLITAGIVGAALAGAAGAVGQVASQAIVDSYAALKHALQARFGKDSQVMQAVKSVEEKPDLPFRQEELAYQLNAIQAGRDAQLVAMAEQLIALVKTAGKPVPSYQQNITGNQNINVQGNISNGSFNTGDQSFGTSKQAHTEDKQPPK